MKYIVITGHPDYSEWELRYSKQCLFGDIRAVTVCEDQRQVEEAISNSLSNRGGDWALFELVSGKFEQRSVIFEPDGCSIKNIQ